MKAKSFIACIYRFCLLSLVSSAVRATMIANPDSFGEWDSRLVAGLFVAGVFCTFLIALMED